MRNGLKMALGAAVVLGASAFGAQAMPLASAPGSAPLVETVAMGCGPGFFRGPRGFCRPMGPRFYGGPRRFYGGPRFYGPRPYGRRFYGRRW